MKISHERAPAFVKEYYYPDIANRSCIHFLSFLCWFLMILLGATLIGVGTSNTTITYPFCSDAQTFCTESLEVQTATELFFYIKLKGFHQYNRLFMDYYSIQQLHGNVGNKLHCGDYYTYGSLSKTTTSGGYRVNPSADAHPCGEVMVPFNVDIVFLIDSAGGTPSLDNGDLISEFNKNYHFIRLEQHQVSQWVDVQSQQFVNYFTVAVTGVKYQLVGKTEVSSGSYQIVMQNNFLSQGEFTKELVVSEVGLMGATNHLLGFALFAYGIVLLFFHVYMCFKWRK